MIELVIFRSYGFLIKYIVLVVLLFTVSSCANNPLSSYKSNMDKPLQQLKEGRLDLAESSVINSNQMLYYLEQATLLRLSDQYDKSNLNFTLAQKTIDDWISSYKNGTLGQVSDTLTASLINDRAVDYTPKDYEKVMLPTYKALNYIALSNLDDARVEITRMYNIEDIIQNYRAIEYAKYEEDNSANFTTTAQYASLDQIKDENQAIFTNIDSPQVLALKNGYQNAFSHYLAGFLFEALAEPSLARPGYLKALQLNPSNNLIKQSISNIDKNQLVNQSSTDLLIVEELGHAPQLKSVAIPVTFMTSAKQNSCIHAVTIAFPSLVPDNETIEAANISVDNKMQQPLLFTDFNLMAARYLHDNLPNIFLHNILRVSKDMALQQSSCGSGGSIAGLLATVSGIVLGAADERTWATLPSKIYVTRVRLSRGKHTIQVYNSGIIRSISVDLTKSYAVLGVRVIGSAIYFSSEQLIESKRNK